VTAQSYLPYDHPRHLCSPSPLILSLIQLLFEPLRDREFPSLFFRDLASLRGAKVQWPSSSPTASSRRCVSPFARRPPGESKSLSRSFLYSFFGISAPEHHPFFFPLSRVHVTTEHLVRQKPPSVPLLLPITGAAIPSPSRLSASIPRGTSPRRLISRLAGSLR